MLTVLTFSPKQDVDDDDLVCLMNYNSEEEYPEANIGVAGFRVLHHLLQKVPVIIEHDGAEDPTPEEEEAHESFTHHNKK